MWKKLWTRAHAVKDLWARQHLPLRSSILLKIADKMEENLELLALAETLDNGKRFVRLGRPTFLSPSITSVISPVVSAPRKAR